MHLHFLGICGTFMGSLAILAKELGYRVSGSDQNVYPPMSTQLEQLGIEIIQGYDPSQLDTDPDLVIVGNAMSRGNPCVEAVLERGIHHTSGPQWLHDHLLRDRWVLAVSGTHGKTTTATMLAWILEYAGLKPGFLIGGVPLDFDCSARLGETDFFVIEADEYDTAFFDKRSKFVHYNPRTLVINNLEFDHADIFDDLAAIQKQFHHLMRLVPTSGRVIYPSDIPAVEEVIEQGSWSELESTSMSVGLSDAAIGEKDSGGQRFQICVKEHAPVWIDWELTGEHNQRNALHALLAARHVGVTPEVSAEALSQFKSVKRRMELLGQFAGVSIYDDFAHHPTAIATTLQGMRAKVQDEKLIAIIEPRSNTMKQGVFKSQLAASASQADAVFWYQPEAQDWSLSDQVAGFEGQKVFNSIELLLESLKPELQQNSHIVVMSNGGFEGIHGRIEQLLTSTKH